MTDRISKKGPNRPVEKNLFANRRGFTYLLVSSFLIAILLIIFFTASNYTYQDSEAVHEIRIRAMNDFVKNLDTDIHRATYIAAFRTMLALEDYVTTSGDYLSDINDSFAETFYYGTINGSSSVIMENSSFQDYLSRVQDLAGGTGLGLSINVTKIVLTQHDPWSMDVDVFMQINITDSKKLANWVITKDYLTTIPILNLRDPLYSKNTFNRVPNTIRALANPVLVNGADTSVLQQLINGSYYLASSSAPSFLMRFEGLTNSDPNGIESIINIQSLSDQGIPVDQNKVKIDFIYFNNISTDKICNVQNIPSTYYFVIPSDRKNLYQISTLNYSSTCP